MSRYRHTIFTVETPIPHILKDVTLYEDTWENKIVRKHPEMEGREFDVENSIVQPTKIFKSQTVAGNIVFVNESVRDPGGRSLRVPVRPDDVTSGEVRSAYFSSEVTNVGELIWSETSSAGGSKDR